MHNFCECTCANYLMIRSTGLAANLTSPTNEFSATPPTAKERSSSGDDSLLEKNVDSKGGSILGLRSSKFANLEKKSSPSPEAKVRGSIVNNEDSSSAGVCPKPKPLPKPRPWSIVGVDRKSGEVTSVNANADKSEPKQGPAKSSVRDLINNMNKDATNPGEKRKVSSLPRGLQPPGGEPSESSANSPRLGKKTDSTSDDPRILKLDDDYSYEGVMDV